MHLRKLDQCSESSYENYIATFEYETEQPFSSHLMNLDYLTWIEQSLALENKSLLPDGYVPAHTYFLVNENDNILGNVSIRTELNDFLKNYGGNIGYILSPCYRGLGLGTLQLKLALEEAKKLGLVKVLLTCDKSNIPSSKVILNNNGVLDSESVIDGIEIQRYWINI